MADVTSFTHFRVVLRLVQSNSGGPQLNIVPSHFFFRQERK